MAKISKKLLSELTSENAQGPFVTIMLNTHVAHQEVEHDQLLFKNFAKEAKKRFEKKYTDQSFAPFQEKINQLLTDQSFWRSATTSVAVFLTKDTVKIERLSIPVDNQYYVSDLPYILAVIKNAQFNYSYYMLALNRDSMKLYGVFNKVVKEIALPEGAPTDLVTALGDEITQSSLNYSSQGSSSRNKEGVAFHGVNVKDEEVEIDWVNYYQAVDTFLAREFENPEKLPIYLFALPENQTQFKKVAKNSYFSDKAATAASPAQLGIKEMTAGAKKITEQLTALEISEYQDLMNKKFIDQLVDIKLAAAEGKVSHLFIATSNLVEGFGADPDTEYDRRQVLNEIADDVVKNSGQVYVLEQKDAPDEKSLLAVLRY